MPIWAERLRRETEGLVTLCKMMLGWRPHGPEDVDDEYWGSCPHCGGNDGHLNVGRSHWFVCHQHRGKWWGGYNVFSSWRHQSLEHWTANARLLSHYQEVLGGGFRAEQGGQCVRVCSVRDAPAERLLIECDRPEEDDDAPGLTALESRTGTLQDTDKREDENKPSST